ncbi:MAG: excinuclease ABC subunit UvrC [Kiloniellales bacterium]
MTADQKSARRRRPGGADTETHGPAPNLARGVDVVQRQARTLSGAPGVYRMVNARGDVLYVGKANNLKKRVASYAGPAKLSHRLQRMIAETVKIEVITTHTEAEALLLEANLIKRFMPRYNVLLRDDKSFPYILITGDHDCPQVTKHRGARSRKGEYFGPFASAGAVNRTITALQRAFLLRNCSDTVFQARTRPCLQYQIKRCSAPCVGYVTHEEYAGLVAQARDFLSGNSRQVQQRLAEHMTAASRALDFEAAAAYRDRIRALTQVQSRQDINLEGLADADVIAAHQAGGQTCVQVFFFRAGRNYGNRAYFPRHARDLAVDQVLAAFIGQFYDNKRPPPHVMLSHRPAEGPLIEEALGVRAGGRVRLMVPRRGAKRKLIEHALDNAREALGRRLAESSTQRRLLEALAKRFGLEAPPRRIEVYDNSHVSGTHAAGAMIVSGPEGLVKNQYRTFTIKGARDAPAGRPAGGPSGFTPGDDYAMLREVLTRRFSRALKEDPDREGGAWPELILLDGGKGQLNVAGEVFAELGIDDVAVVAIAKGPDRDAGRERFFLPERGPVTLEPRDPVLYFLQRLRDEAHRFAIGAHRHKRSRAIGRSPLDDIPGIGAVRRRALLHHFGSARNVARAGLADLERAEGISKAVAKKVYDHFHADA